MKPLGIAIIISTNVFVGLVAQSETVHLYTLIHWPSAVLVLGLTFGVLVFWQPPVRWRRFLAFLNNRSQPAVHLLNASRQRALACFLTAAGRSALIAGLAGEVLGVAMIVTSAGTPATMEPGISLASVSLLYGWLLSELVFQRMRKRVAADAPLATPAAEQASPKMRPRRAAGSPHATTS